MFRFRVYVWVVSVGVYAIRVLVPSEAKEGVGPPALDVNGCKRAKARVGVEQGALWLLSLPRPQASL